jgi:hypothetical protein
MDILPPRAARWKNLAGTRKDVNSRLSKKLHDATGARFLP